MLVYHSSTLEISHPDISHSRNYLDFGKGFYVTSLKEQAIKYAMRFILREKTGVMSTFQLDEDSLSAFKVKQFDSYNGEWLDFILNCRSGNDTSDWDVVIGGVADDKIFRTIDLFFTGDISRETALQRLSTEIPNNQYCFRSEAAISKCLKFIKSEVVNG